MSAGIPRPIRVFLLVALGLDGIGIAVEWIAGFVLHLGDPYRSPVYYESWACDLTNYARLFPFIHTRAFFSTIQGVRYEYPAPVALFYGLFLNLAHPVPLFEATIVAILLAAAFGFGLHLRRTGLTVFQSWLIAGGALALSYPALFELRQGNMEIFVCVLVAVGVLAFVRGHHHIAAVCFGVAGAMKIFPLVYLGLFVARRRYLPLASAGAAALLVTLASLRYLDPSITLAWHGVQAGLAAYQGEIAPLLLAQTAYDHSLLALGKDLLRCVHPHLAVSVSAGSLHAYLGAVALTGLALFFFRIQRFPVINQVLALCVASILLPPVSFDYTLLNLYVPWALLVCFAFSRGDRRTPGLVAAFAVLAVLTSIQTELIIHRHSAEGAIKTIALCCLLVIAVRYPFEQEREDRALFAESAVRSGS